MRGWLPWWKPNDAVQSISVESSSFFLRCLILGSVYRSERPSAFATGTLLDSASS
jgi:hypothetical protein